MFLSIPGRIGTPRAANHFDRSMETPVPYRCSTAAKISAVAAAMRVAISHSSKWSSARLSTLNTRVPPSQTETAGSAITPDRFVVVLKGRPSVHLDVKFFGDQVEHFLPDTALGPIIGRRHRRLPGLALIVGQIVQRGFAGLLDLSQGILILLDRDRVGVVGCLVHRLIELLTDIRRQSVPEF